MRHFRWGLGVIAAGLWLCPVIQGLAGELGTLDPAEVMITDVGQGNNAKIIRLLLKKSGVEGVGFMELANPEDLNGIKVVVVGVGASTKGLGAAGLDVEKELDRAKALLDAARAQSILIIGVHIGGPARRGELSDTLNRAVVLESDHFVVWRDGNQDGFFTELAKTRWAKAEDDAVLSEHFHEVDSKVDVGGVLKGLLASF